jgi:hypothetical protein
MKAWMLFALPMLAACGGSGGALIDAGSSTPIGDAGDGGAVADNGGTVQFAVAKAYLSRGQWCGTPPPFTSGDEFLLVLVGPGQQDPVPTIQIVVYATAPVQVPQALTVVPWKPGPPPGPGSNDVNSEAAYSKDAQGIDQLGFDLGRGITPSLPDPNPYDQATLTALAIPKQEGDTLVVRAQLHFTDGATLDQTFTSPVLDEMTTPCGGP